MPIIPKQPMPVSKAHRLYDLTVDAVQGLTLPELMAVKRGDEWRDLSPDVRKAFENIARQLG